MYYRQSIFNGTREHHIQEKVTGTINGALCSCLLFSSVVFSGAKFATI